ncbi:MAG: hypothetical protein Q7J08_04835 [Methanocorpusculum sp.]|uniref:hypothetical protein n=1 Tax=Methanocorpusculum sp. TaxID=2058474 RepID=UPI00271B0075|nr:hypothetical protein [Methanocorpusculum sp.]MDO9523022.1 hypothetical protein [Methanocorpusculum sp.]
MKGCITVCRIKTSLELKFSSISPKGWNIIFGAIYGVFAIIVVLLLFGIVIILLKPFELNDAAIVACSGSVVIGIIALFTLIVTSVNSENAQKTSYMPFILMDFGNKDSSKDIFHSDGEFRVTLESDNSASNLLPEITRGQLPYVQETRRLKDHLGWAISLKNIGNGTAHSISLKVNNAEIFSSQVLEKGQILSGYCYVPTDMVDTDLHVVLTFEDMMNNKYVQEHDYCKHPVGMPTISLGKPQG